MIKQVPLFLVPIFLLAACMKYELSPGNEKASKEELLPRANRSMPYTSMYMWTGSLKQLHTAYLRDYFVQQKVNEVMFSFDNDTLLNAKAEVLVRLLQTSKIRSQTMIGNTSFIFPANNDKFMASLDLNSSIVGIYGIHVDVEPYTYPDWSINRAYYMDSYVNMVQTACAYAHSKNLRLTVSIPLFYDTTSLRKIFTCADKVYVMAYNSKNVSYFKRRMKEELAIDRNKITVAIRPKDFTSKTELYDFMSQLSDSLAIPRIALHDLKGMMELPE